MMRHKQQLAIKHTEGFMHCPECDKELSEGDKFCFSCGAPIQAVSQPQKDTSPRCPQCGEAVAENDKFCFACGTEIEIHPAARPKNPHLLATLLGYAYFFLCLVALLLGNIAVHSGDYELLDIGLAVVAVTALGLLLGMGILAGYLLSRKHPRAKRHAKILILLSLFVIIVSAISVYSVA
jgi:predicted nucleic acid-binding Zn ribbon protein